jgi:hypothetical protein
MNTMDQDMLESPNSRQYIRPLPSLQLSIPEGSIDVSGIEGGSDIIVMNSGDIAYSSPAWSSPISTPEFRRHSGVEIELRQAGEGYANVGSNDPHYSPIPYSRSGIPLSLDTNSHCNVISPSLSRHGRSPFITTS